MTDTKLIDSSHIFHTVATMKQCPSAGIAQRFCGSLVTLSLTKNSKKECLRQPAQRFDCRRAQAASRAYG
ncbi:hypothetical protein [Noviherbaspirillum sp.]|uniref:hypothetical protein n=1 Tax=Noviherbaspirillum sp. TaxID=1926288 RepID=UPI002FE29D1A